MALCLASVVVFLDAVIGDDDDKSDPKTIWIICVSLASTTCSLFPVSVYAAPRRNLVRAYT